MNQTNMFCKNCGSPLTAEDKFCKGCGAPVNIQQEANNNQQPMYNQGQNNVNQPVNNRPMGQNSIPNNVVNNNVQPNKPKRKWSWASALIGLVAFVVAFGGVYFLLNRGKATSGGGGSSETTKPTATEKSVTFSGYTFKLPSRYNYLIENNVLTIANDSQTHYAGVQVLSANFDQLASNKENVIATVEENGLKVNKYEQKTYNGLETIAMEVSSAEGKMIMGYVKIDSSKLFVGSSSFDLL